MRCGQGIGLVMQAQKLLLHALQSTPSCCGWISAVSCSVVLYIMRRLQRRVIAGGLCLNITVEGACTDSAALLQPMVLAPRAAVAS